MSTVVVHRTRTVPAPRALATSRSRAESAAPGPVRLTRRGRAVVLLAVLVLLGLGSVLLGSGVVATGEAGESAVARTVTIQPGQTLWDLAREADPGADPRAVVDDIVELNALTGGGDVQPGQKVAIPAY